MSQHKGKCYAELRQIYTNFALTIPRHKVAFFENWKFGALGGDFQGMTVKWYPITKTELADDLPCEVEVVALPSL